MAGILFLEDMCITANDPSHHNVKGFLFMNPNAFHKLAGGRMEQYFHSLRVEMDDFEHDNY